MSSKEIYTLKQMSTGDQTQYIRGKIAERGTADGATFTRDGFDNWAESTAPARVGQMEKVGAEVIMEGRGGAMTVHQAKKYMSGHGYGNDEVRLVKGGFIPIPQPVKDAVDQAKKLIAFWRQVSSFINDFEEDLDDNIINNPKTSASLKAVATQIKTMLNNVKSYQKTLDEVANYASLILGSGKRGRGGARGGDLSSTITKITGYAKNILAIYNWFRVNRPNLTAILNMRSLQPLGQQILAAVDPIMDKIGLGHPCSCKHGKGASGEMLSEISDDVARRVGNGGMQMMRLSPTKAPRVISGPIRDDTYEEQKYQEEMSRKGRGGFIGNPFVTTTPVMRLSPTERPMTPLEKVKIKGMGRKGRGGQKMMRLSPIESLKVESGSVMDPRDYDARRREAMMMDKQKAMREYESMREQEMMKDKQLAMSSGRGRKRAPSARGAIVKKVMREQGLSLPQASKYVKEHGLY